MVYSENRYLSLEEMKVNAEYIFSYLINEGWTKNAICGMLGNMQTESTINSGIWQSLDFGNMSGGFGLVQWTPATKYFDWADLNELNYSEMDSNLLRLLYEVTNNIQWINPSMTFYEFTQSEDTPYNLAMKFLQYYERPADPNQPKRGVQADYWYSFLEGVSVGGKPLFPTTEGLTITSPYGWRIHPIYGDLRFHGAIDIGGGGINHPIYATQDAVVLEKRNTSYGGYTIRLKHTGDNYYSQYQHMKYASPLSVGTRVSKGQIIGTMGTTGDSDGIHLDFAIATSNTGWYTEEGTIDPEVYLGMSFDVPPTTKKKKSKVFLFLPKRRIVYK